MKLGELLFFCSVTEILLFLQAEARYKLEIQLVSYSNPNNQDFDGGCCEIVCSNTCDVTFYFCVRDYQFSPPRDDFPCDDGLQHTIGAPITTSYKVFTTGSRTIAGRLNNPLVFTGNSAWPGGFQLMTRVEDDDPNSDDLLDRVIVDRRQPVGTSFSSTYTQRGYYGKVTMQFKFRVTCQTNYYGSTCVTYCLERDSDTEGHYTCGPNGERVCRDGYSGADCLTIECADGCDRGTCSASGLCDICESGWSGPLCSECRLAVGCDPDRARCNVPGECICSPDYSGALCQIDEDVCGHQTPCSNGGSCVVLGPDAYMCQCPRDYTGLNCQQETNFCQSLSPCLNGGTCQHSLGSYTCICPRGWTGENCSVNIDECSTDPPCQNGGTCSDCEPVPNVIIVEPVEQPSPACLAGYTCACPEGFFGEDCEVDIDYCESSPCENGGDCQDIAGGPGYSCTCPGGLAGVNCEENIDECAAEPCLNGGTCRDAFGSFTCSCPSGFNGSLCETNINDCLLSTCNASNSRGCQDGVDSYLCDCLPGFTGRDCDVELEICEVFPCLNGGTCTSLANDFLCACPVGFVGPRCGTNEDNCHPHICLFGGTCIDQVDAFTCDCLPGHTGLQCEVEIDPCSPTVNPCANDTVCLRTDEGGFDCSPCAQSEAGCGLSQGQEDSDNTGQVVGGVIGGVFAAALVLIILIIVCCCCKYGCCCCSERDKEEPELTDDHTQNNPLYFGVSTMLSSSSRGGTLRPPLTNNLTLDQMDNGYTSLDSGLTSQDINYYNSFSQTQGPAPNDDDHHYEHIPVQRGNGIVGAGNAVPACAIASGSYSHLPGATGGSLMKSGKYDKLAKPEKQVSTSGAGGAVENPYVMPPVMPPVLPPGGARPSRRDIYTLLPTPTELKKMADESV